MGVKDILWWGRFDEDYSRNGLLRHLTAKRNVRIRDFRPLISRFGDIQAGIEGIGRVDLVWVPCFRHRDVIAASRWAHRRGIKVVFDPLISAYDKKVGEFGRIPAGSAAARRLLRRERKQFASADLVIADTSEHAAYFRETLAVDPDKIRVVYVGAQSMFGRTEKSSFGGSPLKVLFYGSFLPLHGPETIIAAAAMTRHLPIKWTFIGDGPLKAGCLEAAAGLDNVEFAGPVAFSRLPGIIGGYDVVMGVFGVTEKAGRVMPNKFFQSLACGRPVVTRQSQAYPAPVGMSPAVRFVPPGDARALADAVTAFSEDRVLLEKATLAARDLFESEFGEDVVSRQLDEVFRALET